MKLQHAKNNVIPFTCTRFYRTKKTSQRVVLDFSL